MWPKMNPLLPCIPIRFVTVEDLQLVEVFNLVGQQVMVSKEPVIDMSALTEGIYFVRVICDGKMITKRIVKQ